MKALFAFAHMSLDEALQIVSQPGSGVTDVDAFKRWWEASQREVRSRKDTWRSPVAEKLPSGHEDFVAELRREPLSAAVGQKPWDVGMVHLDGVISFQPTLIEERLPIPAEATEGDLGALLRLCLAARSKHLVGVQQGPGNSFTLSSTNFNLRVSGQIGGESPQGQFHGFIVNHGLPWVQVVAYRGRYVMRDGYHRAVGLMRAGVRVVPAVILTDASEVDVGLKPGFFSMDRLMSDNPPLVSDFLDDRLCMNVEIPRTVKVVRIVAEEFLVPADGPPGPSPTPATALTRPR